MDETLKQQRLAYWMKKPSAKLSADVRKYQRLAPSVLAAELRNYLRNSPLLEALTVLNWSRGRGEIVAIESHDGYGVCTVQCQYSTAKFKYRIMGNRVFARGSSRKFR